MPLLRLFLDICLFKKGPQDAPASSFLVWLTVGADLLAGVVLSLLDNFAAVSLIQAAAGVLMLAAFVWVSLYLGGKMPRFQQTASAIFGTDALISAAAIPLLALRVAMPETQPTVELLMLAVMFWSLAVIAHILRHALSVPLIAGMALALLYAMISYPVIVFMVELGG